MEPFEIARPSGEDASSQARLETERAVSARGTRIAWQREIEPCRNPFGRLEVDHSEGVGRLRANRKRSFERRDDGADGRYGKRGVAGLG